ncbi:hypothetical protein HL658_26025 [Azospirillum sp. RWY-5-1]|uniref:DUF2125 domain-containing protein n=1 Tax=Azospirillum oleiclasticum TaxID=2735135 RepID=A0ABX2TK99_9PROT|nr:hypothetical protein [Azospirillum oleiclasticum]NYZ16012.1 hypothetical protein [Azospirillum oleiclasticum]NYZ23509.1 hypothetical protein [Azospirillum oleiclasticum]
MNRPSQHPAAAIALAVLLASASVPALAQGQPAPPVTPEGAQEVAKLLKEGLVQWLQSPDGPAVEFQGDPLVMPSGDRYAVALPAFAVKDKDGSRLDVGAIRAEVTPLPDRSYGLTATLPSTYTLRKGNDVQATISLGRQQLKGVWSAAFQNFLSVDAALGDLKLTAAEEDVEMTLGSVSVTQDLRPDGGSVFSGPAAIAVSNLSVTDSEGDEYMSLGGLTMEGVYTRLDLAKVARITEMAEQAARTKRDPSPAAVLEAMRGILGGATMRMRAVDVSVYDPDSDSTVTIGQFSMRGGVEDLDRAVATVTLGLDGRGLGIDPTPGPAELMPDSLAIQISLNRIPAEVLMGVANDMVAAPGGAGDPTGPALAALTQAGTELRIDTLDLNLPIAAASVTGAGQFTQGAAFGATGGVVVTVRGLDAAVKQLQPKPGKKPDPSVQETLGVLTMLQALGQQGRDAQGREQRTYKIDVTQEGQFLLNGADMMPLLGMGSGQPQPQPQQGPRGGLKP